MAHDPRVDALKQVVSRLEEELETLKTWLEAAIERIDELEKKHA